MPTTVKNGVVPKLGEKCNHFPPPPRFVNSPHPKLVIGLLGFGTVGGGVVEVLSSDLCTVFKKILVKNPQKPRNVKLPEGCMLVSTWQEVVEDEEINVVVEVMGGTTDAKTAMIKAIANGKHVVTANKAALSLYMDEVQKALEQKPHVGFFYEAAVCGGIPIIDVIRRGMACDEIVKIVGIMNGTSNYMLTSMDKDGVAYEKALEDASEKGYAEADPSADVEGWDARSKLCILAKLAFGMTIDENQIFCDGISKLQTTDFEYAKMINHTIKPVGIAEKRKCEDGSCILQLSMSPVLVPLSNPLGRIEGVTNVVQLFSTSLDSTWYIGPGAGRYPTANSVVSDILELANRLPDDDAVKRKVRFPPAFPVVSQVDKFNADFEADFFLRFVVEDQVGVVHKISGLCADHKVSIFSLLQTPIVDPKCVPFVIITEKCRLSQIKKMYEEIRSKRSSTFSFMVEGPIFLRYLT